MRSRGDPDRSRRRRPTISAPRNRRPNFGPHLLLAGERPNKIHSNILSQCDNLLLLRMNSHADLAHLATILSQVPTSLMEQAIKFGIGESLLAGRIVQNPTFAKFEGRLSVEGGSDIPTTWAAPRA